MAILKELMTDEASVLLDSDAANKALDADAALQKLGSDLVGECCVTATVTVWDENAGVADDRLRLVEKTIQGRDFTRMRETVSAIEAGLAVSPVFGSGNWWIGSSLNRSGSIVHLLQMNS